MSESKRSPPLPGSTQGVAEGESSSGLDSSPPCDDAQSPAGPEQGRPGRVAADQRRAMGDQRGLTRLQLLQSRMSRTLRGQTEEGRGQGAHPLRARFEAELAAERGRASRAEAAVMRGQEALRLLQARFEEERVSAVELRTMLDAMEFHRSVIERELNDARGQSRDLEARANSLREELEARESAAQDTQRQLCELKSSLAAGREREVELGRLLSEREAQVGALDASRQELTERLAAQEATLLATRRARDQWLERLQSSGREREDLRNRVAEQERQLANALQLLAEKDTAVEETQVCLREREGALAAGAGREAELRGLADERAAEIAALEAARRELAERLAQQETALREQVGARAQADEYQMRLAAGAGREAELRGLADERAAEIAALEAARRELAERLAQQETALREQVGAREQELRAQADEYQGQVAALEAARQALEQRLAESELELAESRKAAEESEQLRSRMAELAGALRETRQGEAALQDAVNELRERLREEETQAAALRRDVETQTRCKEELESALAKARAHVTELEVALESAREWRTEKEREHEKGTSEAAQLVEQVEELEGRLAEVEAERDSVRALKEGLDWELQQLRRRVVSPEEAERLKAENARLQAKIEEVEQHRHEAVQRHSGAVSGYMLELNQRTEALRHRDAERQRLMEEISVLQTACDDSISQLAAERHERELLILRVRELEATRNVHARAEQGGTDASRPAPAEPVPEAKEPESGRVQAEIRAPAPQEAVKRAIPRPSVPRPQRFVDQGDQPITVIHIEDDAACREVVRATAAKFPHVGYTPAPEAEAPERGWRSVLAVNLLTRTVDPLAAIAESGKWGVDDPCAFTYCAHGGRGIVLGLVDFFPPPFEPDACASRLLGRPGGLQRLLAVSEDVETMGGLREILGRVHCSTAIAFDGRQALELLPMVKPEVLLVDLNVPRGESLRLISRIRSDPKMAALSIAVLWTRPIPSAEFLQHVSRAVRDYPLAHQDIEQSFRQALGSDEVATRASQAACGTR